MKEYFNCSLFDNTNLIIDSNSYFDIIQKELILEHPILQNQEKYNFKILDITYNCYWLKQDNWNSNNLSILIPIKDNVELLKTTINNLYQKNIVNHSNIIIIDDRSTIDIKKIVLENKLSYLRVDNEKGFNFSMLNNIAAFIAHRLGCKQIILWNSDLWCVKEEYYKKFVENHENNNSTISGAKLIYPPIDFSMHKEEDSENIDTNFPHMKGKWRNTVQFGGSTWISTNNGIIPLHSCRFKDITDNRVDCDKGESFITGALQMIDLDWFIECGGMNPSLSKNYQDVDLCLKALEKNKKLFYFGKNIYFYHDESVSLIKEGKKDLQLLSDQVLFNKIWQSKLSSLVL